MSKRAKKHEHQKATCWSCVAKEEGWASPEIHRAELEALRERIATALESGSWDTFQEVPEIARSVPLAETK